jgi:hypothetical protein
MWRSLVIPFRNTLLYATMLSVTLQINAQTDIVRFYLPSRRVISSQTFFTSGKFASTPMTHSKLLYQ